MCLEACKKLHEMGALDDHLLPLVQEPLEDDLIPERGGLSAGAGMCVYKFIDLIFRKGNHLALLLVGRRPVQLYL